ncbi:MAG: hypothetical protein WCK49_07765 [Myxococcaceae bacterium]
MVAVRTSKLRENIYQLLDQVIQTGIPLEIERKGAHLRVVFDEKHPKKASLIKRNVIVGNPEDLVHIDWYSELNLDPL